MVDWRSLVACPQCLGELTTYGSALQCDPCRQGYPVHDGIPDLRLPSDQVTETVRKFYEVSPFPGYPPRDSLGALRARAERSEFARLLDQAIPGDARVVEIGCGTGQMSLYLTRADRVVIGADMTRASLALGAAASRRFGVTGTRFIETDLRAPGLRQGALDVVYSSGVLHHTPDPAASFAKMIRLCRPGGIVVLGLYNVYARLPHRLRRALGWFTGYRFIPFDPVLRDRKSEPARRTAWLRDQYQHPEEHRHSVAEVQRWFRANDVEYLRTYPNALIGAEPLMGDELFSAAEDDWGLENVLAQIGWAKSLGHEGGLFVTIGRRAARPEAIAPSLAAPSAA
jgi:SAM-dependent methyltransferase